MPAKNRVHGRGSRRPHAVTLEAMGDLARAHAGWASRIVTMVASVASGLECGRREQSASWAHRRSTVDDGSDEDRACRGRADLRRGGRRRDGAGKMGKSSIGRFLKRLRIGYEKTLCAADQKRPGRSCRPRRMAGEAADLDHRKLVFIDETWAYTNMTQRYGRGEIGTHLNMPEWKTL